MEDDVFLSGLVDDFRDDIINKYALTVGADDYLVAVPCDADARPEPVAPRLPPNLAHRRPPSPAPRPPPLTRRPSSTTRRPCQPPSYQDVTPVRRQRVRTEPSQAVQREVECELVVVCSKAVIFDGIRWRKYGEKVLKGVGHRRSYFKATSIDRAMKRVERCETGYTHTYFCGVHVAAIVAEAARHADPSAQCTRR